MVGSNYISIKLKDKTKQNTKPQKEETSIGKGEGWASGQERDLILEEEQLDSESGDGALGQTLGQSGDFEVTVGLGSGLHTCRRRGFSEIPSCPHQLGVIHVLLVPTLARAFPARISVLP